MEKSINLQIEDVKNQLYEVINKSKLPISFMYYLMKDLMQDLTDVYNQTLTNEYNQYQEEQKKEDEEETTMNDAETTGV